MVDAGPGRDSGAWQASGPPTSGRRPSAANSRWLIREMAANTLIILSVCLLGFAVWFAFLSRLYYDRVQITSYATFRNALALATAPTGPTNPANPKQLLAPGSPVAVLNIPEINLTTVVFEGTSGGTLEGGPGLQRDTQLPGQAGVSVILGRRTAYGGPFSRLPSLRVGDRFSVTTGQGVSTFRVIDLRRGGDPFPPQLTTGQGRVTLVTADGPPLAPTGVLYVDADLTSQAKPTPAMILNSANLGASEQDLGTDSNALVPVVLWGVLLVAVSALLAWAGRRWGRWQTWIIAVPTLGFLSLAIADQVTRLLPNLL